jgi:hypothetical protein
MKSAMLWGLGALNVVLAAVLVNKYVPSQTAHAQVGRPSDYIMVPGQLNGISNGVVFMVDTSRGQLSAMSYDDTNNTLSPMPSIDLGAVFRAGGGVAPGGGGGARGVKPR